MNVAHTELWIFDFFVISQSEQICKWGIKTVYLVMTCYMGSTCAHHYPHTKFHQCSPYRTLDIWLFLLLPNQNRYANEVLNMRIRWRQTMWVILEPITTHIPSLMKFGHCVLIRERRFTFWCWRETYISTSIHTERDKWKLSGPSSIAGGTQLFEPIVLEKKRRQVFAFFKSIFLIIRSLNIVRWFYGKKTQNWEGKSVLNWKLILK